MRFGKIKKEAINLELTELISILGLEQPQKEPNWANIKKIEKKFPFQNSFDKKKGKYLQDSFTELFEALKQDEMKDLVDKTLKKLNCSHEDFTNFLSAHSMKAINQYLISAKVEIEFGGNGTNFFESSFRDVNEGIVTLWPVALFTNAGFRSLHMDFDDYKRLLQKFFQIYNSKKKLTKFFAEFVNTHPNYSYIVTKTNGPPNFRNHKLPSFKDKISPDLILIILIVGLILFFNLKDPYWSFEENDSQCELNYDGWAWNLEGYYSQRIDSFSLGLSGNALIPTFHDVPSFYATPTKVSVFYNDFWLVNDSGEIQLALNEDDEWGYEAFSDNSTLLEFKFLEALKLSNEIVITYRDFDTRKIKTGKMKFSPDGSAEAIDDFIYCVRKY